MIFYEYHILYSYLYCNSSTWLLYHSPVSPLLAVVLTQTFCSSSPLQIFMIPRFHFICNSFAHRMITCTMKMHFSFSFSLLLTRALVRLRWLSLALATELYLKLAPIPTGQRSCTHAHALKHLQLRKMFNYLSATTQALKKVQPARKHFTS